MVLSNGIPVAMRSLGVLIFAQEKAHFNCGIPLVEQNKSFAFQTAGVEPVLSRCRNKFAVAYRFHNIILQDWLQYNNVHEDGDIYDDKDVDMIVYGHEYNVEHLTAI